MRLTLKPFFKLKSDFIPIKFSSSLDGKLASEGANKLQTHFTWWSSFEDSCSSVFSKRPL